MSTPGVIRQIASHKIPLSQAEPYLDHPPSCSPGYGDFCSFRDIYQFQRKSTFPPVAFLVLIVGLVASWTLLQMRQNRLAQTALLDLRDRSIIRGIEPGSEGIPGDSPLELSLRTTHLNLYLRENSREEPYEVRILKTSGEPLLATNGFAKLENGIVSLQVVVNLGPARPGEYPLQIRTSGRE
jgi:hypothetical protein